MIAHPRRPRPVPRSGEQGATLILAMAFLAIVLGATTFLFSLAHAQSGSLQSFRADRAIHYGADAALQTAIAMVANDYRMGVNNGDQSVCSGPGPCLVRNPQPCPILTVPLQPSPVPATAGPAAQSGVVAGSTLSVTCKPTYPDSLTNSDARARSGWQDYDGGQAFRDVTFVVNCYSSNSLGKAKDAYRDSGGNLVGGHQIDCSGDPSGGAPRGIGEELASARVYFLPTTWNPGNYTPIPCHGTLLTTAYPVPGLMDPTCRAVVPKIINYTVYR